jgi:hypothetical protein
MTVQEALRNALDQIEGFRGTQEEYLDLLEQMRDECAIRAEGVTMEIENKNRYEKG